MWKWLRQQWKNFYAAMGQVCECWWRICREIIFSPDSNITCFTFYVHLWPIYWLSLVLTYVTSASTQILTYEVFVIIFRFIRTVHFSLVLNSAFPSFVMLRVHYNFVLMFLFWYSLFDTAWSSGEHIPCTIFWYITPCSPSKVYRRFGGTYRHHFLGRRISRARD
jgi:hypothetical protein